MNAFYLSALVVAFVLLMLLSNLGGRLLDLWSTPVSEAPPAAIAQPLVPVLPASPQSVAPPAEPSVPETTSSPPVVPLAPGSPAVPR